jgi:hypothetical protein
MSEQASSRGSLAGPSELPAQPGTSRDGATQPLRMLGLAVACVVVAALAAATFVLSYSGIHAVAIQAGVSPQYARYYPLLIDAMLVIALAAVVALRGAGLPSRILAWLTLLAVLAAAAGADALHATGHMLQHNAGAVTAAVLPWALVLIAFLLLLALLRHLRLRRHAGTARRGPADLAENAGQAGLAGQEVPSRQPPPLPVRTPQPWQSVSVVPGFSAQLLSSAVAGAAAGAAAAPPEPVARPALEEADDGSEAPADDDSLAQAGTGEPANTAEPATATDAAEPETDKPDPRADEVLPTLPAETDDDMPVFHRIWSSPTPPEA